MTNTKTTETKMNETKFFGETIRETEKAFLTKFSITEFWFPKNSDDNFRASKIVSHPFWCNRGKKNWDDLGSDAREWLLLNAYSSTHDAFYFIETRGWWSNKFSEKMEMVKKIQTDLIKKHNINGQCSKKDNENFFVDFCDEVSKI